MHRKVILPPGSELLGYYQSSALQTETDEMARPHTCYVISDNRDRDGREMSLLDALLETVGMDSGGLLSCIAGKLTYCELEGFSGRYILQR